MKYLRLLLSIMIIHTLTSIHGQDLDSLKWYFRLENGDNRCLLAKKIGVVLFKSGKYDSAQHYFQTCINLAKAKQDFRLMAECANNRGVIESNRGENRVAILYYDEALRYYLRTKNDTLIAESLHNIGIAYKRLAMYDEALDKFTKAAKLFQHQKRKEYLYSTWMSIGNIYRELGTYDRAFDYLNKVLEARKGTGDAAKLARALHNMGIWYLAKGEYASALVFLKKALVLKDTPENQKTLASTWSKIGEVYSLLDSLELAEYYLLKSWKLRSDLGYRKDMAVSANHLAVLYTRKKEWPDAQKFIQEALGYSIALGVKEEIRNARLNQKNYYEALGHYDSALKYAEIVAVLDKEILDEKIAQDIINNQIRYEVYQKDLKMTAQEIELKLVKNRNVLLSLVIILSLIVTVFIVWAIFWRYKAAKQRSIKAAAEKRREEMMRKEMHHRTSNHLQNLAAIIGLEKEKNQMVGSNAEDSIQDIANRMHAIGLLHKNLYQATESTPEEIDLTSYLKNITDDLMTVYRYNRNDIKITYRMEEIDIDVNQAVLLGLVVNETFSNAYKHAFKNQPDPALFLGLKESDGIIEITIKDNGKGFDEKDDGIASARLKIIDGLVRQLNAKLEVNDDEGISLRLLVPKTKVVKLN